MDVPVSASLKVRREACAWCQGDPPGIGEAEAGVSGGAAGQGRGEHSGGGVVIVVNLCGFLSGVWAQDVPGLLDEPSFPSDRSGEEQGIEHVLQTPGTSSVAHLEENVAAASIELDDEAQDQLASVQYRRRRAKARVSGKKLPEVFRHSS